MNEERIEVRLTESGKTLEVVVLRKTVESIEVVLGSGVHSVRCTLTPTRNRQAYAGTAMGREMIYQRGPDQVRADIARIHPVLRKPGRA